jgi:hypothetical protein
MKMSFAAVIRHAAYAYLRNARALAFFSLMFFVMLFVLYYSIPTFIANSGIFLRFGSVQADLNQVDALFILCVFLFSTLWFSVTITGVNKVIKVERTLKHLSTYELEQFEEQAMRLFVVYLIAFALFLAVSMAFYTFGMQDTLGALSGFIIYSAIAFAPQALVIDGHSAFNSVRMSVRTIMLKPSFYLLFLAVSSLLLVANTWLFLQSGLGESGKLLSLAVNALLIFPFLEALKTQIYLSKYTLL